MTNYKEVFQLAESKGYELRVLTNFYLLFQSDISTIYQKNFYSEDINENTNVEYLFLECCRLQKWLRAEHRIEVFISNFTGHYKPYYGKLPALLNETFYGTYEDALLNSVHEALKLI